VRPLQVSGLRTATQPLKKTQALILLGFPGGTHRDEDRYALDVMTAVLSGMAGRLFQAVREAQGLSYTLGAVHAPGWDPGYVMVYAATRPSEETAVLKTLNEQLRLAVAEGFTEEEVQQAKQYLIGMNRMELQHVVELTKRAAMDELNGVGHDEWRRYEEAIAQVSPSKVHEAAQRYLTMDRHVEVIVSPNGHGAISGQ
jgi:zinc protease